MMCISAAKKYDLEKSLKTKACVSKSGFFTTAEIENPLWPPILYPLSLHTKFLSAHVYNNSIHPQERTNNNDAPARNTPTAPSPVFPNKEDGTTNCSIAVVSGSPKSTLRVLITDTIVSEKKPDGTRDLHQKNT